MITRLKLESFETTALDDDTLHLEPAEFEEAKLVAFEKGYTAGWDDAIAAQDAEMARLHSELGQNLLDLSFTYQEARAHILASLKPLFAELTAKVLPRLAQEGLGGLILEQLVTVAEGAGDTPIAVVANPKVLPQIRDTLSGKSTLPFRFTAEPSLTEGQVYLRFDQSEIQIDLDGMIARIEDTIQTYFHANAGATNGNH